MRREAKAVKGLRGVNLEDPYDAYSQTTCRQMQGAYRPNIFIEEGLLTSANGATS